jgi:hypothetical protein
VRLSRCARRHISPATTGSPGHPPQAAVSGVLGPLPDNRDFFTALTTQRSMPVRTGERYGTDSAIDALAAQFPLIAPGCAKRPPHSAPYSETVRRVPGKNPRK